MVTDYQARKKEVLESYEVLEGLMAELIRNSRKIEMPNPLERSHALLSDIRDKAEKVRADRFNIMVAGEAKSGKSTFINAYLGIELLPMDVKQCTSAIVEIKYGKEFSVQATYADGRKEKITGNEAAMEFLKKNAALDDEYRDIPVPTINSEILVKAGMRAKEKGSYISVSKQEVEDLIQAPEVQEANIHNVPSEEYSRRIKDYIAKKKDTWQDLVVKIEVFFPFGKELRGIEIIDSPGVCAKGGLAEITASYIEHADAIIFLKPISGQDLASTHFNQFMRNASVERNKDALFLVLTRATDLTPADLLRLEEEAYRQFNNLSKSNILIVDSKAELYAKKLDGIDDIKSKLKELNAEGTLDDFVVTAYADTNGLFGEGDTEDFIRVLREKSRFETIYNALEVFGRKAHYLLLCALLDSICKLYSKLWNDTNIQMDMFRQKAEDPTKLAAKIALVKQELDEINSKMYKGVDEVVRRFRGNEGLIRTTAEKAKTEFETEIASIDAGADDAFNELERKSIHKIDAFKELTKSLQKEVVAECDKALVELSDKSTIPFESLKPNFTDEDFKKMYEKTESGAYETHSYETGATFKKSHTYSVYSQNKHFSILKNNITDRLDEIKNSLIDNLEAFVEKIRTSYIVELKKNAEAKKRELDAIMEAKASAEQIIKIIDGLEIFAKRLKDAQADAGRIKGGIEKNV